MTGPVVSPDLKCRSCGAALDADDVREGMTGTGVARCRYCRALTRVGAAGGAPPPLPRPKVERPSSFSIEETGTGVRIVRRWFVWAALFLVFFTVAWNAFLVFWYGGATKGDMGGVFALFGLPFLVVGLGLIYGTLALLVNRTTIDFDRGTLTVVHGPLPWKGNLSIEAGDVAQVYCEQRTDRDSEGRRSTTYRVHACLKDGRRVRLLSGLPEAEHALYVEQTLEQHLGIRDRPIVGEMGR